MNEKLIIAIDGGAGTGTSTAAKGVATALGVPFLNTGSIYRAVAWACQQQGVDLADEAACAEVAASLDLEFDGGTICGVNGRDVSGELYSGGIGQAASKVSSMRQVRNHVDLIQHETAREFGAVLEGRDIGTHIFPEAPFKFFFTCDPAERARRLRLGGRHDETAATLLARDDADVNRTHGALFQAGDALVIDTTDMSIAETIAEIIHVVHAAGAV